MVDDINFCLNSKNYDAILFNLIDLIIYTINYPFANPTIPSIEKFRPFLNYTRTRKMYSDIYYPYLTKRKKRSDNAYNKREMD